MHICVCEYVYVTIPIIRVLKGKYQRVGLNVMLCEIEYLGLVRKIQSKEDTETLELD